MLGLWIPLAYVVPLLILVRPIWTEQVVHRYKRAGYYAEKSEYQAGAFFMVAAWPITVLCWLAWQLGPSSPTDIAEKREKRRIERDKQIRSLESEKAAREAYIAALEISTGVVKHEQR